MEDFLKKCKDVCKLWFAFATDKVPHRKQTPAKVTADTGQISSPVLERGLMGAVKCRHRCSEAGQEST